MPRWAAGALALGGMLWVLLLVASPSDLLIGTGVSPLVYAASSLVCHQQPDRSFYAGSAQLPVCARCLGLYVSAALGAAGGALVGARLPAARRVRTILALAALPTAATIALEWGGISPLSNAIRAAAALPLGAAAGWIVVALLRPAGQPDGRPVSNTL